MRFDLSLKFEIFEHPTFRGAQMSDRSRQLAAYARQFMQQQPEKNAAMLQRNRILDEGFVRLKETLKQDLESQIEDLNTEPGCSGVLKLTWSSDEANVHRTDDPDVKISIRFDAAKRTISLSCDKPTKFRCILAVALVVNETSWYFQAGDSAKDLSPINEAGVAYHAENALYALFGVNR